jgi:small-conductance mechanosensitive channel
MNDLVQVLRDWVDALDQPAVQFEIALIAVISLVAFAVVRFTRWRLVKSLAASDPGKEQRGFVQVARLTTVLWPLLAALLLLIASRVQEARHRPAELLRVVMLVYFAGGAIRLVQYAIKRVFRPSGILGLLQRAVTLVAWLVVALHVAGLLSYVTDAFESIGVYRLNGSGEEINLLQILQGTFWIALTLVIALWAGAALETRLMRISTLDASLQVALGRFGRALLVVIAVLVSMQVVGIPLGVLSVFGGALGVGLGLGLQRIASNYVSGFILLLDRSLQIGDLIAVDKYTGSVAQIRTRYTVLKALDGTEAILPNELLVSSPVLNHSYTSRQTRINLKLQIAFDSNVEEAIQVMTAAAQDQARVLADPPPVALVLGFAADGLDMELQFWVADPEVGTGQTRSDISRAILRGFRACGVAIPNPRRDIKVEYVSPAAPSDK